MPTNYFSVVKFLGHPNIKAQLDLMNLNYLACSEQYGVYVYLPSISLVSGAGLHRHQTFFYTCE